MDHQRFVFRDPEGGRWRRVRRWAVAGWALVVLGAVAFVYSLLEDPRLQSLPESQVQGAALSAGAPPAHPGRPKPPASWLSGVTGQRGELRLSSPPFVRLGFLDDDRERAMQSLRAHGAQLTHLAPPWFRLVGLPARLEVSADGEVAALAAEQGVALMPMLTNLTNETFEPEPVEHLLRASAQEQQALAVALREGLRKAHARGVIIVWETLDPAYHAELTALMGRLHRELSGAGLELWLSVPVGDDIKIFDLDDLAPLVDRFVATLYYETGEDDGPGPIASLAWAREWLEALVKHGDPAQWVIGVGTFGFDWPAGGQPTLVSFQDVMARAATAGASALANGPSLEGLSFSYRAGEVEHAVWFLDATTFWNQQRLALQHQAGGVAIDRLGTEDPGVWTALGCGSGCDPGRFQPVDVTDSVATVGEGDFLTASSHRRTGSRLVSVNEEGFWGVTYRELPQVPLVRRVGDSAPERVALSFDDGPDPLWTPAVLDILQGAGVKAAFFVTGQNANAYPELVRRIVAEGHEIGNHSFSHPDLAESSRKRIALELNATQRAIEHITGSSTLLFRPPYDADRTPHSLKELTALEVAQKLGYTPAMASIDPLDWQEPSADEILKRVRAQRPRGRVILLHDGGGDRSQTVAALPGVLGYLQARDDEIVLLHDLLGVTEESLMPAISPADPAAERLVAGTGLGVLETLKRWVWAFLLGSTALLFLRTLFIVSLALRRAASERRTPGESPTFTPPVSAVVALYNEEKVIGQTLTALLASRYAGELEVILVDDGSSDRTSEIVAGIAASDRRVRLLRQANGGKASALRAGLAAARHEIILMLDGDTQFEPDALGELVAPLRDPRVGAVSGQIDVGNQSGLLGRFQSLEYVSGFNLDRRTYDALDAISVVPGAASAYRASAITKAGGIQADTLAEDTDLTLALHRAGYLIRHTTRARAVTEAPATARALLRQRKRWAFGTLQCLWKHRSLLLNPRFGWLGLFTLPSIGFFQVLLVAIAPLVDLGVLVGLLQGHTGPLLLYTGLFTLIDVALAMVAYHLEGGPLRNALLAIPMRFVYRPILSLAVLSSLYRALRGRWVGWGAQERRGFTRRWAAQGV